MKKPTFYAFLLFLFAVSVLIITNASQGQDSVSQQNPLSHSSLDNGHTSIQSTSDHELQVQSSKSEIRLNSPIRNLQQVEAKSQGNSRLKSKNDQDFDSQDDQDEKSQVVNIESDSKTKKPHKKSNESINSATDQPITTKTQPNTSKLSQLPQLPQLPQIKPTTSDKTISDPTQSNIQSNPQAKPKQTQNYIYDTTEQQNSANQKDTSNQQDKINQNPHQTQQKLINNQPQKTTTTEIQQTNPEKQTHQPSEKLTSSLKPTENKQITQINNNQSKKPTLSSQSSQNQDKKTQPNPTQATAKNVTNTIDSNPTITPQIAIQQNKTKQTTHQPSSEQQKQINPQNDKSKPQSEPQINSEKKTSQTTNSSTPSLPNENLSSANANNQSTLTQNNPAVSESSQQTDTKITSKDQNQPKNNQTQNTPQQTTKKLQNNSANTQKSQQKDNLSEKIKEQTKSEDNLSDKFKEQTKSEDNLSEKFKEQTKSEDNLSEKFKEQTKSEDNLSDKFKEQTKSEDNLSDKFKEQTKPEDNLRDKDGKEDAKTGQFLKNEDKTNIESVKGQKQENKNSQTKQEESDTLGQELNGKNQKGKTEEQGKVKQSDKDAKAKNDGSTHFVVSSNSFDTLKKSGQGNKQTEDKGQHKDDSDRKSVKEKKQQFDRVPIYEPQNTAQRDKGKEQKQQKPENTKTTDGNQVSDIKQSQGKEDKRTIQQKENEKDQSERKQEGNMNKEQGTSTAINLQQFMQRLNHMQKQLKQMATPDSKPVNSQKTDPQDTKQNIIYSEDKLKFQNMESQLELMENKLNQLQSKIKSDKLSDNNDQKPNTEYSTQKESNLNNLDNNKIQEMTSKTSQLQTKMTEIDQKLSTISQIYERITQLQKKSSENDQKFSSAISPINERIHSIETKLQQQENKSSITNEIVSRKEFNDLSLKYEQLLSRVFQTVEATQSKDQEHVDKDATIRENREDNQQDNEKRPTANLKKQQQASKPLSQQGSKPLQQQASKPLQQQGQDKKLTEKREKDQEEVRQQQHKEEPSQKSHQQQQKQQQALIKKEKTSSQKPSQESSQNRFHSLDYNQEQQGDSTASKKPAPTNKASQKPTPPLTDSSLLFGLSLSQLILYPGLTIATIFLCNMFFFKRSDRPSQLKSNNPKQYNPSDAPNSTYNSGNDRGDDNPNNRSIQRLSQRGPKIVDIDNDGLGDQIVSDRRFYKGSSQRENAEDDGFGSFQTAAGNHSTISHSTANRQPEKYSAFNRGADIADIMQDELTSHSWQSQWDNKLTTNNNQQATTPQQHINSILGTKSSHLTPSKTTVTQLQATVQRQLKQNIAKPTTAQLLQGNTQQPNQNKSIKPLRKPINQSTLQQFEKVRIPDSFNELIISNSHPYTNTNPQTNTNPHSNTQASQPYLAFNGQQNQAQVTLNSAVGMGLYSHVVRAQQEDEQFEEYSEGTNNGSSSQPKMDTASLDNNPQQVYSQTDAINTSLVFDTRNSSQALPRSIISDHRVLTGSLSFQPKQYNQEEEQFQAFQEPNLQQMARGQQGSHREHQIQSHQVQGSQQNDEEFIEGQVITLNQDQPQIIEQSSLISTTLTNSKSNLLSGQQLIPKPKVQVNGTNIQIKISSQEGQQEDDDPFKELM